MAKQIVLAGSWATDEWDILIEKDGSVVECKDGTFGLFDRITVAVENEGPLEKRGNIYKPVHSNQAVAYFYEFCTKSPYRGYVYWDMILPEQLKSLKRTLRELMKEYSITHRYDNTTGTISERGIAGVPGIYLASGLRKERMDLHPQPELLTLLKKI